MRQGAHQMRDLEPLFPLAFCFGILVWPVASFKTSMRKLPIKLHMICMEVLRRAGLPLVGLWALFSNKTKHLQCYTSNYLYLWNLLSTCEGKKLSENLSSDFIRLKVLWLHEKSVSWSSRRAWHKSLISDSWWEHARTSCSFCWCIFWFIAALANLWSTLCVNMRVAQEYTPAASLKSLKPNYAIYEVYESSTHTFLILFVFSSWEMLESPWRLANHQHQSSSSKIG